MARGQHPEPSPPCRLYLESTCPRNRLLYLRLGFQDYRQLAMADDAGAEGPTL